jgi:hypothetical protein
VLLTSLHFFPGRNKKRNLPKAQAPFDNPGIQANPGLAQKHSPGSDETPGEILVNKKKAKT